MATRAKMDRAQRAKQFMPFAALKGYEDALRAKERQVVPKIELSEEMKEELDRQMAELHPRDMVTVFYFFRDEYVKSSGLVAKIDKDARYLQVVNNKIPFSEIYRIEKH